MLREQVKFKVRQDTKPLPWGALIDDRLVQTCTRDEAVEEGGTLMRLHAGLCTHWPDREDWQGVYWGLRDE